MSAIPDRCRNVAAELESLAEVIGNLERERDYYRAQALRWAQVVDRQHSTVAERVLLESLDAERERDQFAERLPA